MSSNFRTSPSTSEGKEGLYNLHRIAQHNATAQQQQDHYSFDGSDYLPSRPSTAFTSPQPVHRVLDQLGRPYHTMVAPIPDLSMPYHTDVYGHPVYPVQTSAYYVTPPPQDQYNETYQIQDTSTAAHSERSENRRGSRRARGHDRSTADDGSPSSTSVRPSRKSKKAKADKGDVPELEAPFSVLTKDMTHVPLKDTEAWVTRSNETRKKEVVMAKGKISRPMNAFILYRAAYADRVKAWGSHNNHQIVSQVAGLSWDIETPEVKEKYHSWAKVERDNHAKAHPTYKFSPAKPPSFGKKRKVNAEEEDNSSELDSADFEWTPSGSRGGRRAKRTKNETHLTAWPAEDVQFPNYATDVMTYGTALGPGPYPPHQYSHWYQDPVHADMQLPNSGDIYMQTYQPTEARLESAHDLIGLPGVDTYNSLEHQARHTFDDDPSLTVEAHVDPLLMSYSNDVEGHESHAPISAGLQGLADVQAFNELHNEAESPKQKGSSVDND